MQANTFTALQQKELFQTY